MRNKRVSNIPGEKAFTLIVSGPGNCDLPVHVDVILGLGRTPIAGFQLPPRLINCYFQLPGAEQQLRISDVNGLRIAPGQLQLKDGDIIDLCHATPTKAGGHHLNLVAPLLIIFSMSQELGARRSPSTSMIRSAQMVCEGTSL